MALADLSVELGDDSDGALEIEADEIAGKFIEFYWRQTLPYLGKDTLRQNKGPTPVVISLLLEIRGQYGDHLAAAQRDRAKWSRLTREVARNIRAMPLRYLQNVGRESLPFLYDPPSGTAPPLIRLYPGVAFCLLRFHGLVAESVQTCWARWVADRRILKLIRRWLKAGVIEDGCRKPSQKGTPQGAVITPLTQKVISTVSPARR